MLDGAAQRRERLLVAEITGLDPPVQAEHQVGTALVLAQRVDAQLATALSDPEVRRRPAGGDARLVQLLQRKPDAGEAVDDGLPGRPSRLRSQRHQHGRAAHPPDRGRPEPGERHR